LETRVANFRKVGYFTSDSATLFFYYIHHDLLTVANKGVVPKTDMGNTLSRKMHVFLELRQLGIFVEHFTKKRKKRPNHQFVLAIRMPLPH